jgi:hypothetical protein
MLKVTELRRGGYDMCGMIPEFLSEYNERSAREQLDQAYRHGGGWRPMKGWNFEPESKAIKYPGDPEMYPVAMMELHEKEMIYVYPHAWVVIVQPDGSFEIARMD